MFSFFKRFKGSQTSDAAPQETAEHEALPPVQEAPAAPSIAPVAPPAAAQALHTEDDAIDSVETVEIVPPPAPEPAAKQSWLTRLKSGLSKTSSNL
ncbi:MAG TPA: signal recognition particle-docking protein FtsY, partial [Paraburkholderia sp.]|nr:signal recognition particle-docking protein FtsY [Paraburkholderia sp.]